MPPRVPRQVADAIGRSGGSTRYGGSRSNSSSSNASSRLLSPSTPLSSSSSSTISQRSSTRATQFSRSFTCSTCLSQQQQHQKQQNASSADSGTSRSHELHATTQPADHAGHPPTPQHRLPRWAETPSALRAPFSVRKNEPANRFAVNEDPARLDQAYESVFGPGGAQLLPAEVKWLAVTHKSFDQGRRGFNDRLAFVGKRLVDLQTSLAVLAQPGAPSTTATTAGTSTTAGGSSDTQASNVGESTAEAMEQGEKDTFGREIFQHPVMAILPKLTSATKFEHTETRKLALLAREFGLQAVVRWKPRKAADLAGSGQDGTLVQALYAMVGALAMQRGGDVAVKAVRARILPRLGLRV